MDILYKKFFQSSPTSTNNRLFKNVGGLWNVHGFLNIDPIGFFFLPCARVRTNLCNDCLDWNFNKFFHTNTFIENVPLLLNFDKPFLSFQGCLVS